MTPPLAAVVLLAAGVGIVLLVCALAYGGGPRIVQVKLSRDEGRAAIRGRA